VDDVLKAAVIDHEEPIPKGFEQVDGELVEKKMGAEASEVGILLAARLVPHCQANNLGRVFGSETTYRCFNKKRTARKPDLSFIRHGRLKKDRAPAGEVTIPPDLAVEVVSPKDEVSALNVKLEEYLAAGVPMVWVIDPVARVADVFRPKQPTIRIREGEDLEGGDVVPGFRCPLACILPPPDHERNGESKEDEP
jgi:Uma2 family endonuclease